MTTPKTSTATGTARNAAHREPRSETETLREDLEYTRQHLADTVQELSRRLNVPHRMKETAADAGHRLTGAAGYTGERVKGMAGQTGEKVKGMAGHTGEKMKGMAGHTGEKMKGMAGQTGERMKGAAGQTGQMMKQVPGAVKSLPSTGKRYPKVTAAVGGAMVLGAGAVVWMARRHK